MISRRFVRLYFLTATTACVGLAFTWWWIRPTSAAGPQDSAPNAAPAAGSGPGVAPVRPAPPPRPATDATNEFATASAAPAVSPDLLHYASQPERRARADVVLALLEKLKAMPNRPTPEPEVPAPPAGPWGAFFPELIVDPEYGPEYRRLFREIVRQSHQTAGQGGPYSVSTDMKHHAQLMGDPVVSQLVAERMASTFEMDALKKMNASAEEQAALNAQKNDAENRLRERLGEDGYQRLLHGKGREYDWMIAPLEVRLGYTAEPMSESQYAAVKAALTRLAESKVTEPAKAPGWIINQSFSPDPAVLALVAESLAPVLSAAQLAAFRQVQTERLAVNQRRKLPPESELPKPPGT